MTSFDQNDGYDTKQQFYGQRRQASLSDLRTWSYLQCVTWHQILQKMKNMRKEAKEDSSLQII